MIATFSIATVDVETKTLAIATASNYLAVGSLVPSISVKAGLVVSQSLANPNAARKALKCLEAGGDLQQALDAFLLNDAHKEKRQVGIMNLRGESIIFSGPQCLEAVESYQGSNFISLGNTLTSGVIPAMTTTYETSIKKGLPLCESLIASLESAQDKGGDKRGKLSASLLISREGAGYMKNSDHFIDLRVDAASEPIAELKRCYRINQLYNPALMHKKWVDIHNLSSEKANTLNKFLELYNKRGSLLHTRNISEISIVFDQENISHLLKPHENQINQSFFDHIAAMPRN